MPLNKKKVSFNWGLILRAKIFVIIFFLGVFVFACMEKQKRRNTIVIADSNSYEATIFRQNCAICHGNEADGKEMDGTFVPSLRFGKAAKKSEEEIYDQIKHGKLPMPSFKGQLTESEIRRMVKFVMEDLQGRKKLAENAKNK